MSPLASGRRSAIAVATRTPAANAMNGCSRWWNRSAAIPPASVEKKGRRATRGIRGPPVGCDRVSRRPRLAGLARRAQPEQLQAVRLDPVAAPATDLEDG